MSVYNGAPSLQRAIDSVLNQTYSNFRFFIVNDGSIDDSLSIMKNSALRDNRIVIMNQVNKGLTATINELVKLTDGRYIARQDADDCSEPTRFARQVDYLERNPSIAAVGCWYRVDFGKGLNWIVCPKTDQFSIRGYLLKGANPFMHGAVMMRRSAIEALDGPYRFRYAQDLDLWLRLSDRYSLSILPTCLATRFEDENIVSVKGNIISIKLVQAMVQLAKERADLGHEVADWKQLETAIFNKYGYLNMEERKIKHAKKQAFAALLCGRRKDAYDLYRRVSQSERIDRRVIFLIMCISPTSLFRLATEMRNRFSGALPHTYQ
jgi:glycosyltransferase involved in cell wall biosynthesis